MIEQTMKDQEQVEETNKLMSAADENESTPLLDTSNEIEQRSQDWPIDPNNSES